MQVKEQYDLIVIGDQLSGLFLAAGAAQAGLHVLVLDESSSPTVHYELPSGRFLGDLICEPVIGVEENSKVDHFLRSLGLYQNISDLFPLHQPNLQIIGPRCRVNFAYKLEKLKSEFQRELGLTGSMLEEFCRAILGITVSKKSFSEVIAKIPLPVSYEIFGWMQSVLFGSVAVENLPFPAYKSVVDLAAKGIRYPMGGRSALKERLMSRILVYGGTVKKATRVEEIVFEKNHLAGVLLSSYEGFVRSSHVVGAMGAKTFYHLLPQKMRSKKLSDAVSRISPKYWRMNFTILVPDSVIPEGLGTNAVIYDQKGANDQDHFLHVQVFDKEVYGGIPGGHKAIICRVLVPYDERALIQKNVERILRRSVNRLEEIIPFLREKPYFISPDPENLNSDLIFQKFYRFPGLDHIPPSYLVYEASLGEDFNQTVFIDWKDFGLPGMELCSRDIRPLHGLTGEIFTAMDLLAKLERKKGKNT